jgi:diadenosine tetraphosphate (Ap4A) HIT family hydrolase/8-oxo-dGTP pyrophosphatase MutT (NUDIX family)
MLSPYIKLKNNCTLCSKLRNAQIDQDFLFDGGHNLYVFKSPFSAQWPGALMPVFKRHIYEHSEIRDVDLPDTLQTLVCLEKAILKVTKCKRINLVKFANIAQHLHWHIIPRYLNENFSTKCTWEILDYPKESLYKKVEDGFFAVNNPIYPKLIRESIYEIHHRGSSYFGCALFLRPVNENIRNEYLKYEIDKIIGMVREIPKDWECLLMKRNYFDYAWDFVGGNCDPNEFPEKAMLREVSEELGWKISKYKEVTRQWRMGAIKGFVYLAIPDDIRFMEDIPPRIPCDEVQTVKYFNLINILNDVTFPDSVRGRVLAFLNNESDFISIDA